MAKSRTPTPTLPTLTLSNGLKFLQNQLSKAEVLLANPALPEDEFAAWRHSTGQYIKEIFGTEHDNVSFFRRRGAPEMVVLDVYNRSSPLEEANKRTAHLKEKVSALKSIIQQIGERLEIEQQDEPSSASDKQMPLPLGNEVFIVHGHNSSIKEATARLILQLGLKPVILHEQNDGGRTVVEKLEQHASSASFAVVLLTGDDIGRSLDAPAEDAKPRARQNVILELGLFVGLLSRKRVRIIYEDGVDLPSDIAGVLYTKYDAEGIWKYAIGKELKAAGFQVSLDSIE
jgi:predicted nucleotide-binding protein